MSATVVSTNVGRGRRALRAMPAAMPTPTPTSEKASVNWANPAFGMLTPVLSANETPAPEATAAREVVATEATMAAARPCFQTGCRWAVEVGALGVVGGNLRGGGHVGLPFLGGPPGATRTPLDERVGPDPTGRQGDVPRVMCGAGGSTDRPPVGDTASA